MLNEFVERRDKLVDGIMSASKPGAKHIVVIPSATTLYMSDKIPYVFRQNTDFRYLTGCLEPDSSLIIQINEDGSYKTMLLVRPKNKHSELWEGPRTG
jgi:Xaa-Pro aminopeptidase